MVFAEDELQKVERYNNHINYATFHEIQQHGLFNMKSEFKRYKLLFTQHYTFHVFVPVQYSIL